MRRRHTGQSIVEMAFVLPFLLVVVFGIIEFGYLIFAYSTVSQAARNGAEAAAQLPPYETWLAYKTRAPNASTYPEYQFTLDPCVSSVIQAVKSDLTVFDGRFNNDRDVADYVTISYPEANTRNLTVRGPIEVTIVYPVQGITPLFQLLNLNGDGSVTLRVTQRRSLENLGLDPTKPRGVACAKDMADYRDLYGTTP